MNLIAAKVVTWHKGDLSKYEQKTYSTPQPNWVGCVVILVLMRSNYITFLRSYMAASMTAV